MRLHLPTTKYCPVCQLTKSTDDFYRHPSKSDGYEQQCAACKKAYVKAQYYQRQERRGVTVLVRS